jgi:hypothetical protein
MEYSGIPCDGCRRVWDTVCIVHPALNPDTLFFKEVKVTCSKLYLFVSLSENMHNDRDFLMGIYNPCKKMGKSFVKVKKMQILQKNYCRYNAKRIDPPPNMSNPISIIRVVK